MTKQLIERLRQLELRITTGANEACGEAATLLERQAVLLKDAKIALSRLLAYAEEWQREIDPEWDGQCFDDSDFGIARAALKALNKANVEP